MKEFLSKHIALKVDVIGAEDVLFAGASVHLSARKYFFRLLWSISTIPSYHANKWKDRGRSRDVHKSKHHTLTYAFILSKLEHRYTGLGNMISVQKNRQAIGGVMSLALWLLVVSLACTLGLLFPCTFCGSGVRWSQHSVEVDPKVTHVICSFDYNSVLINVTAGIALHAAVLLRMHHSACALFGCVVKNAPQCLCLVWMCC